MATATDTAAKIVEDRITDLVQVGKTAIDRVETFQDALTAFLEDMETPESKGLSEIKFPEVTELKIDRPVMGDVAFTESNDFPDLPELSDDSFIDITPALDGVDITQQENTPPVSDINLSTFNQPNKPTISSIAVPTLSPVDSSLELNFKEVTVNVPDFRTFEGINLESEFPAITTPSMPTVPTFSAMPSLTFNSANLPQSPILNSVNLPVEPEMIYPAAPQLSTIILPSVPVLNTISFSAIKPVLDFNSVKPAEFVYSPDNYVSDVWQTVLDKIKSDIETGGVGVNAVIREGMYNEMIALQRVEHERAYREAQARFGANGFHLPTGAFISALSTVEAENARQEESFRRKIYLDQMTLAQQNTQWALDKGVQLEQILRDFFLKSEDRRLEVSKAIAQRGIEILQSYVAKFNAEVEAYKSEAATYEIQLKGEIAKVEIYKAQIEGASLETEVQKNLVQIYTASLAVLESKAKIFGYQNENAKVQAELENLKIEQYKAALEAYLAGLESDKNAVLLYTATVDAEKKRYDAELSGTNVELEIQKAKSSDYGARMSAVAQTEVAKAQAYAAEVSAVTEIARARSTIYASDIGSHTEIEKSKAQIKISGMQAISDLNKTNVDIYASQLNGEKVKVDLYATEINAEKTKAEFDAQQIQNYALQVDAWKKTLDAKIARAELVIKTNEAELEKYKAQLTAYAAEFDYLKHYDMLQSEIFKADITAYTAEADLTKSENMLKVEEIKAKMQKAGLEVQQLSEELRTIVQGYVSMNELKLKGMDGLMQAQTQLAASALSAANVSASYGYGSSFSESKSESEAISTSHVYHHQG